MSFNSKEVAAIVAEYKAAKAARAMGESETWCSIAVNYPDVNWPEAYVGQILPALDRNFNAAKPLSAARSQTAMLLRNPARGLKLLAAYDKGKKANNKTGLTKSGGTEKFKRVDAEWSDIKAAMVGAIDDKTAPGTVFNKAVEKAGYMTPQAWFLSRAEAALEAFGKARDELEKIGADVVGLETDVLSENLGLLRDSD